ncbi:MAG TPA: hypothetical protein VIX19_14375 [Terriglobales bacterium]
MERLVQACSEGPDAFSRQVAIVHEQFAKVYRPNQDPLRTIDVFGGGQDLGGVTTGLGAWGAA